VSPLPSAAHPVHDAVFGVSYAAWLLFEIFTGRSRKSSDPARARDRGSFFFVVSMIWLGVGLDVASRYVVPRAAIERMRTEIFFVGIVLIWLGIAFRYYAMRVLGRYFTFDVAVHAGQTVIEAGPYRFIRHPSYSGALITLIGFGLAFGNWAGLVALLACAGIGYAYRIHVEESALIVELGDPYKEYMRRTRRIVPFVL
jgi:protein-S-isoprenylcysteine O-methyltransferase Ste14